MAIIKLFVAVCCLVLVTATEIDDAQDLNYEPKIAIQCGKMSKHIDVDTGKWLDAENKQEFCSSDVEEILKYCKKTYPNITITNIVEDNENITLCDDEDCRSTSTVIPYRCLVGQFEADALSYGQNAPCDFGYIHEGKTCNGHDYWRYRAENLCKEKGTSLEKYGILIPCATNMFRGVEYVCCKKAKTLSEIFEDKLAQFSHHIPAASKGCDRSKYDIKAKVMRAEKDKSIKDLAKNLNEAKNHKEELQEDDPQQAQSFFKNTLKVLQGTIKSISKQAQLNQAQIQQQRRECLQIDLNHKKHLAMKSFVNAVREHRDNPTKIMKNFKRFMRTLQNDQSHNVRFLQRQFHSKSDQAKNIREAFVSHLQIIKSTLNEGVEILKDVKSVEGKIHFNLPSWASDIDFKWAHKPVQTTTINPTDPPTAVTSGKKSDSFEEGDENEHETFADETRKYKHKGHQGHKGHPQGHKDHKDHPLQSRAVFAAVIGLSCGALVIMVVIVLALFFRKGSSKRPTKTVIAEDDSQEKRHLLKMQEDGFENPTYKFFVH